MDSVNTTSPTPHNTIVVLMMLKDNKSEASNKSKAVRKANRARRKYTAVQEVGTVQAKGERSLAGRHRTHHTVTQVEQTANVPLDQLEHAGNSLEQAGNSVRGHVAAVHQSASDLSLPPDHTRGLHGDVVAPHDFTRRNNFGDD
jgi:hypothetical protein